MARVIRKSGMAIGLVATLALAVTAPLAAQFDAGIPIECELTDDRQKPGDFAAGQFVSFDVMDGATFTPQ